MPSFHLIRVGDVLYRGKPGTASVVAIDILEIDRAARRARARLSASGSQPAVERWLIETEIDRLRRSPPVPVPRSIPA